MKNKISFIFHTAIFFIIIIPSLLACNNNKLYKSHDFIMGTIVKQHIYGTSGELAASEAIIKLRELEALLSFYNPKSDISKLNRSAGGQPVILNTETILLLEKSLMYARLTGGAFNIMVGPLVKRWSASAGAIPIPSASEISSLLGLIQYQDCLLDIRRNAVQLARIGEMVDLGGIAKGYASDVVLAIYRRYGITSAIFDIGGNIGLIGNRPDGRRWNIGIQDPFNERGKFIGYLSLSEKSLSTSGSYERNFVKNGKRYSHIIDPRTGRPSESGLASATIISSSSVDSDALSTGVFILGAERGIEVVKKLEGIEALLITDQYTILLTRGLKGKFFLTGSREHYKVIYM
jgi:thiamine biosynthesis lipoprotein